MRCSYCGSTFHTVANCPKTHKGSATRALMRCMYCGSPKHNTSACPMTFTGKQDTSNEDDYVKD